MTGARRAAMACGSPATDELLACLGGPDALVVNHVETYHLSSLPLAVVKRNLALDDDVLPLEVSYGDGSPIDNETARRIRLALRAETVTFPWRRGDVLVLDNMLTAHGRRPFTGERRVLVAMGNSYLDRLGRAAARLEADPGA